MKKTLLSTGASSRFGLMLATHLHRQGHTWWAPAEHRTNAAPVLFKLLRLCIDDGECIASATRVKTA